MGNHCGCDLRTCYLCGAVDWQHNLINGQYHASCEAAGWNVDDQIIEFYGR